MTETAGSRQKYVGTRYTVSETAGSRQEYVGTRYTVSETLRAERPLHNIPCAFFGELYVKDLTAQRWHWISTDL